MNSKFVTPLIFSSALTLGALSFVACGEDSNPAFQGGQSNGVSSSSVFVPPPVTETTAIVFSGLSAPPSLTKIMFDGTLTLDQAKECLSMVHWKDLKWETGTVEDTQYTCVYDQANITLSLCNWNDYGNFYQFDL